MYRCTCTSECSSPQDNKSEWCTSWFDRSVVLRACIWLPSGSLSTQTSWLNDSQAKKWSRLKPSSPEPGYPEKDAPPLKTELARSTAWLKWPRQHSAVPAHSTTSPYGGAG